MPSAICSRVAHSQKSARNWMKHVMIQIQGFGAGGKGCCFSWSCILPKRDAWLHLQWAASGSVWKPQHCPLSTATSPSYCCLWGEKLLSFKTKLPQVNHVPRKTFRMNIYLNSAQCAKIFGSGGYQQRLHKPRPVSSIVGAQRVLMGTDFIHNLVPQENFEKC